MILAINYIKPLYQHIWTRPVAIDWMQQPLSSSVYYDLCWVKI